MAIGAHRGKGYHLGFGSDVKLSNLSKANTNRDYRIFEEFAYYMVGKAQSKRMDNIFKLGGKVYAFDSITIDLCLIIYQWARLERPREELKSIPCLIWKLKSQRFSISLPQQSMM